MIGMTDIDPNSGAGAGMTVKEWLQRIEKGLTRIEDKLDTKAEKAELVALEARLHLIESLGTEQSRHAETGVRQLSDKLDAQLSATSKAVTDLKIKVYAILGGVAILASILEVLRQGGLIGP